MRTRETALAAKRKSQPSDTTDQAIGQRLAEMRRERGITQAELAEALGVSQPVVSDYERGALRLHGEQIAKLAALLKVSADELLGVVKLKRNTSVGNSRAARRLQQIERLPQRDQQAIFRTIDAFLSRG